MRNWWESLDTRRQAAIAFPILGVWTFLLNLGPFAQPLGSSIIYGFIEGGAFTALLIYATGVERARRGGGGSH
ncbi:MAG TPA: hypothetical protein VIN56_04670 [Candidatus Dormibacteraeota bacterium]|jgi:hypothetical protein